MRHGLADRHQLVPTLGVQRSGRCVEAIVHEAAALVGVGFALGGVVVSTRHAGVCELAIVVGGGQSQRAVVQLERRFHEATLRIGDGHVVHDLVVGGLVGQPSKDVHGLGENMCCFGQSIRAAVVVHHHAQGVGQFGQVAL